jgi:hypothetical protein
MEINRISRNQFGGNLQVTHFFQSISVLIQFLFCNMFYRPNKEIPGIFFFISEQSDLSSYCLQCRPSVLLTGKSSETIRLWLRTFLVVTACKTVVL